MKESNELLELCKKCYEATGWEQSPNISQLYEYWDDHDKLCVISIEDADDALVPAYTSDYLLDKLPKTIWSIYALALQPGEHVVTAGYYEPDGQAGVEIDELQKCANTLEALLRLTLKLHEEGLL